MALGWSLDTASTGKISCRRWLPTSFVLVHVWAVGCRKVKVVSGEEITEQDDRRTPDIPSCRAGIRLAAIQTSEAHKYYSSARLSNVTNSQARV